MRLPLLMCAALAVAAKPWHPAPPCAAPAGISAPAVAESMCSRVVATRGDVAVREMGLPANETLVAGSFSASQWPVVVGYGVSSVLDFFLGDNTQKKVFVGARTTPVTFRQRHFPNGTVYEWTSAMMVSTAAFPDAAAIPTPIDPLKLEPVDSRLVAVRQFNTSAFPSELDFTAACGGITASTLPAGYAVDANSPWSPTWAFYSGEGAPVYECECWVEVVAN
jgi:hypothetical protein